MNRQVSWWSVHQHCAPLLEQVGSWPPVGTPAWCALPDDDPRKTAALLDAAQQRALDLETRQLEARRTYDEWVAIQSRYWAECEASQAISAAADWPAIAQHIRDRRQFYAERPWLKRVES